MTSAPVADPAPIALTERERTAFRMGVLAAGAVYAPACGERCRCRARIENLRVAIAARGITITAPEFWPQRGTP